MLQTEIISDDPSVRTICEAYWQQSGRRMKQRTSVRPRPVFTYRIKELTARFGLSDGQLRRLVSENCFAFDPDWKCPHCERPREFSIRSQVEETEHLADDRPCASCVYEDEVERDSENWPSIVDVVAGDPKLRENLRDRLHEGADSPQD